MHTDHVISHMFSQFNFIILEQQELENMCIGIEWTFHFLSNLEKIGKKQLISACPYILPSGGMEKQGSQWMVFVRFYIRDVTKFFNQI